MASDIVTGPPGKPVETRTAGTAQTAGAAAGTEGAAGIAATNGATGSLGAADADGAGTASPPASAEVPDALVAPVAPTPAAPRGPWPLRAARAVGRSFADDLMVFFSRPLRLVRERKLRAIPGTLVSVSLIALFGIIQHLGDRGIRFVTLVAGVHQSEPLWEVLIQLPLSMFAPAPMLPAWGAMLQVFVAFGIAECWLGWRKTLAIAVLTSAVTSMAARLMVWFSFLWFIGTPEIDNWQLDTGPSVGVVALLIYLALRLRTYWIVALTAVSMGGEAALLPNLAGREHLVAISLGVITYFLLDVWWPAWRRRRDRGQWEEAEPAATDTGGSEGS